ncbi:RNA polymerase sigma factor [Aeromonas phage 65]|uniref:RNA polymerase sigma-like factor n=2 Tax=Ishigurovirus osborne TaxID=260149 RepID=A0A219YBU9_9CAUD|nr:RNA polymerase sigma factor [Aeromonas phage 65]AAR90904.1 RNA polymerase sigma factor [Aeromonas phage 65]APU01425.1 RNA polymerase sigma factor for late transcription [Aeromonas phage 65.2]
MTVYVDNDKLIADIVQWKKDRAEDPPKKMSDSLGLAIMNIVNGLTEYYRFRRYTDVWKENMVSEAQEILVRKIHKFDENKFDNAHAYVTMIAARCFFDELRKEKKKEATKNRYFIECVYDGDDEDMGEMVDPDFYLDLVDKVSSYEESVKKKQKDKDEDIGELDWLYDLEESEDETES